MRVHSIILYAVGASLLYLLTLWGIAETLGGVIRKGNAGLLVQLAMWAGGAVLWLAALVDIGIGVRAFLKKQYSLCVASGIAVGIYFLPVFISRATFLMFVRNREARDLERVGVVALRTEAALLVDANRTRQLPVRWFGGEVPPADLPPAIRRLSTRADYVTVSRQGVVVAMDGMGGWRGGYMITPPESSFQPPQSRQIVEGVFYVVAQ